MRILYGAWRKAVLTTCLVVLLLPSLVSAETVGGGNLLGHRGMLRTAAANNHPSGWIGLGTDFQYFSSSDFLDKGESHSRMVNTYSIVWAPIRFIEAAFALHVTSDRSAMEGQQDDLMVAVGDPEISLKGGYELGHGIALGGLFDLRFPSGSGFFETSMSSTSFLFALLASYSPGKLPLGIHLNVGFAYDGSENLFDKPEDLRPSQQYAAQLSSFHRLVTRFGAEYNTKYVGPFVELSLEPYMGSGAPGFGDSPGIVSFGARVWPTKSKSFQLLAALDVGVTGVSSGEAATPPAVATDAKYSYVLPRWNLVLRLSYRFDAYAKAPSPGGGDGTGTGDGGKVVVEKPKVGVITGAVTDANSSKPVWNAQVNIEGIEASGLAVNRDDGTFRTYQVPAGRHTINVKADGYHPATLQVVVKEDGTAVANLQLTPKTSVQPGTIRGSIKALTGKNPKKATVLIPEVDRTVQVDQSGSFSIQLKPGNYKLVVSARGFRTQTKKITVREGSTVILNVELHKGR